MRKNVALILALVMIFSMIPMTAFADIGSSPTDYTVGSVPKIKTIDNFVTAGVYNQVRVVIEVDDDFNDQEICGITGFVSLPRHVTAEEMIVTGVSGWDAPDDTVLNPLGLVEVSRSQTAGVTRPQEWRIEFPCTDPGEDVEINILFRNLQVLDRFGDDEVVADFEFNKFFRSSSVKIADVVEDDVVIQMEDINFISAADIVNDIADIRLTQNTVGDFDNIELKLPRGFYWDDNVEAVELESRFGVNVDGLDAEVTYKDNVDNIRGQFRTAVINLEDIPALQDTNERTSFYILGQLNSSDDDNGLRIRVDETRNPAKGDVVADVDGADPSELTIARYGDYVATATALETPTLFAGQVDELGAFEIREDVADSLAERRTITLTLPEGVKWQLLPPEVNGDNGDETQAALDRILELLGEASASNVVFNQTVMPQLTSASEERGLEFVEDNNGNIRWQLVDAERRTIRATIESASDVDGVREGALLIFEDQEVVVSPTFRGPLDVEVGGSAGASGTITLAEVVPAMEASTTEVADVIIGAQNQAIENIVLTEAAAGAAERSDGNTGLVTLRIPEGRGVVFSQTPTAEVVEGDMLIERVWMSANRKMVNVQVQGESDEASSIELSDLAITIDRTAPEGEMHLELGGDALIDSTTAARYNFFQSDVLQELVVANVLDRAPLADVDEAAQVAFTVGSTSYTVNGEMRTMDVAPFISNDRMMIPVRYLEYMFGMQPNWNETTRTVTVRFDGDVYGMAIGSNMITMNGADYMEMDATAEIVNDRTFVPASRFARAMGVSYEWDPVTQTATFN